MPILALPLNPVLCRSLGLRGVVSVDSLRAKVEEVTQMTLVLVADLTEALPDLPSDRHRRAYVRAAFAMAEGVLSGLKEILEEAAALFGVKLSAGEASMLTEESYGLKEDGSVRVSQSFLRMTDNLRFTLSIGAKVAGEPAAVNYRDEGWASFRKSIDLRNRLVHPKKVADLHVSDEEMATLDKATAWYKGVTIGMMLKMKDAVIARKGQLE